MNIDTADLVAKWLSQAPLLKGFIAFAREKNLAIAQLVILIDLSNEGQVTPIHESRTQAISRGYATIILKQLVAKKLVYEKKRTGRAQHYALTKTGLGLIEDLHTALEQIQDEINSAAA